MDTMRLRKKNPGDLPPASEWTLSFVSDFNADERQASFAIYQALYVDFKARYPYHRDLDDEEFEDVLCDGRVGKAILEAGEGRIALPLFGPVSADPWLSRQYYDRLQQSRSVRVVHFFELPGFFPNSEACPRGLIRHLAALAGSNAVLSYTAPEADRTTETHLREMARLAGLAPDEPEHLGSETYFAGKTRFVRSQKGVKTGSLMAAYKALSEEAGCALDDAGNVFDFKSVLNEEEIPAWWKVYWQSFGRIEADHPCAQKLGPGDFRDTMQNPDVFKAISCGRAGDPLAMCLLGDVTAFPEEMNMPYFFRCCPVESGRVLCFRGLFSHAQKQTQRRARHLIRVLVAMAERAGGSWAITFSTRSRSRRVVPYIVQKSIEGTKKARLSLDEIGCLGFYVFRVG